MFDDILVPVSALHSFFFLLFTVPTEIVLGLAAAWMTLRVGRGKAVLAAVFLVPLVVPWTVASGLFYGLFNIHGVADRLSQVLFGGGYSFLWLFHPRLAFGIIVVFSIWKGAPWCYLLLMGALSACPADVLEAARIDGARGLSFWWRVVLPTIRPMLAFVIVLRFLAEAQSYDPVALLTNGGPSFPGATTLLAFYGDKVAFGYYNFGEASAIGTLLGAALVIVAFTGWRFAYPRPVGRRRSFRARPARPRAPARAGRRATPYMPVTAGGDGAGARERASRPPGRFGPVEQQGLGPSGGHGGLDPGPLRRGSPELARAQRTGGHVLARGRNRLVEHPDRHRGHAGGDVGPGRARRLLARLQEVPPAGALFLFVLFCLAIPGIVFIFPQFEEIVRLHLVNTRAGVVFLYVTTNLPLAIFFLRPAFASVPRPLVEAMRVDGVSELGILRRLVLRHSASTIVALSVLVVVWVWGEVPIAQAVLNSDRLATLPLQILNGFIGNPNASYLISIGAPLVLFLATQQFFRRGLVSATLL